MKKRYRKRYVKKRYNRYKKRYRKKNKLSDSSIIKCLNTYGEIKNDHTYDTGTCIINWVGSNTAAVGNTTLRPLFDPEHVNLVSKFKYFKPLYAIAKIFIYDLNSINNAATTTHVGYKNL